MRIFRSNDSGRVYIHSEDEKDTVYTIELRNPTVHATPYIGVGGLERCRGLEELNITES